jgi:hypothetical protein
MGTILINDILVGLDHLSDVLTMQMWNNCRDYNICQRGASMNMSDMSGIGPGSDLHREAVRLPANEWREVE